MKIRLGAAAALLAMPLALVAQTPTPVNTPAAGALDSKKTYLGVRTQQGRVLTDADWNEKVKNCQSENEAFKRKLRARVNDLEIQVRQLEAAVNKADEQKKGSQEHNKAMKDSIRKMLDQIAEINRAANL